MSAAGGVRCGIIGFLYGSASLGWKGRAYLKPEHGAIPAGPDRFRHDERNMAFSPRGLCSDG